MDGHPRGYGVVSREISSTDRLSTRQEVGVPQKVGKHSKRAFKLGDRLLVVRFRWKLSCLVCLLLVLSGFDGVLSR